MRHIRPVLVGVLVSLLCSQAHAAPVICQRKNRITLRPAGCHKKEQMLGTVALTSDPDTDPIVVKANVRGPCAPPSGTSCVLGPGTTPGVRVVNRGASGAYELSFDPSLNLFFPTCVVVGNNEPTICQAHGFPVLTTFQSYFDVNCFDTAGNGVDSGFSVLCISQ